MRARGGAREKQTVRAPTPPLEPLLEVADILRQGGVEFALGGSGLLHALGLAGTVGDWDLTTDAEPGMIYRMFEGRPQERHGPSGVHADEKLRLCGGAVELIMGMGFLTPAGICRVPTLVAGSWRGVPLASPEAWAVAYSLLGRGEKADRLFARLRERGADARAVARLLSEPLPPVLAARLRALPTPPAA
jgi:hypothetical protein